MQRWPSSRRGGGENVRESWCHLRISDPLGPYCHCRDDRHSSGKPGARLFPHEPAISGRHVFTGQRRLAYIVGFTVYVIGGWLFALLYFLLFASVGIYTWWFGALAGLLHGVFLLVCALPLLPFLHPRMASEYHGLTEKRQLEPPGFLGMNYGVRTPLTTLLGQLVYGATLGGFIQLHQASGF